MATKRKTTSYRSTKKLQIPDKVVREFEGTNTYIKDIRELADGATPNSLNWVTATFKDSIFLRGGYQLLGTNRQAGGGRVSGIGIGMTQAGVQVPYFTFSQKILYYNSVTNTTVEIGSNLLGSAAANDDVAVMPYQSISGSWMYFTSPNSSILKGAPSNPSSIVDLQSRAYRGYAKIDTNRMWLWNYQDAYNNKYKTPILVGVSDKATLSQYTQKYAQSLAVPSVPGSKTFSGNLSTDAISTDPNTFQTPFNIEIAGPIATGITITAISNSSQASVVTSTPHNLIIGQAIIITGVSGMTQINGVIAIVMQIISNTDVVISTNTSAFGAYSSGGQLFLSEYFQDDQNGNLTSDHGGTGTINYITGAYTVNFNIPPLTGNTIYGQYYEEDSTSGGIADFTVDGSTNGKGKLFQQSDGGGALMSVWPFDQVQYCFHQLKTWYLNLTTDDTKASNLPYRSTFGIPYWRSAFPTPDGILVLDNSHPAQPKVSFLEISPSVAALITIIPTPISDQLDLSAYGFGLCTVRRWGDYDLITFENVVNGIIDSANTRTFMRNIQSGVWDMLDYAISCMEEYNGALLAGDSLSNNVYTLFSGFDDDGTNINNYWYSKQYDLDVQGMKKLNRFVVRGLIQLDQNLDIYFSYDNGNFSKVFTVQGNGSYVNTGNPVDVGSSTVGSQVVGGGAGPGAPVIAYPFEVEITVGSDWFEYIQVEFSANNIGYVQIDEFIFKDIRWKSRKSAPTRVIVY